MRLAFIRRLRWWLILPLAVLLALSWGGLAPWPAPTPTRAPTTPAPPSSVVRAPGMPTDTVTVAPAPTLTLTPTPTHSPAPTLIPTSSPTPTETPSPSPSPSPFPSPTPTVTIAPSPTPAPTLVVTATVPAPTPDDASPPSSDEASAIHPQIRPAVLANYFPWYDPDTWATGCTSGGDLPQDGTYQSDDPAVIARHIGQAQAAGLDGFAVHWFAPGNRTDLNFGQVLAQSPAGFDSTVTFLYHILPGADQQGVIDALAHIVNTYSGHARFFRASGKPVILFSDLYRVPGAGGSDAGAIAAWEQIRAAVDPGHAQWWIAEGLEPGYLQVFDGLYVYKIDHACCPNACASASRWAGWTREWEQRTGQPKLWVGTVMPGWNDLNSAQAHCADLRVSSDPFARQRADGAYYARTWEAVLPTHPDLVILHSWNEWVEGSYIEPSVAFGDLYVQLTAQWVARYKEGE